MQKLVIHTQYRENYAAHNEDFVPGVSEDHWKFKGGTTYVVPNFKDFSSVQEVVANLEKLICYSNPASEEYILSWDVVPHAEKVCEDWESPVQISIESFSGKTTALRVIDNRVDGWMRKEILEQVESWTMMNESERKDYRTTFLMDDGDIVEGQAGLREWIGSRDDVILPEAS